MITKFKIYESLEERTTSSFRSWYNKVNPVVGTQENEHKFFSQLYAWQLYKSYFDNKDIFSYKTYEDYQNELDLAKQRYYSKLKNIKEGFDFDTIYEDKDVKVIVPLTLNGSCKYGYNTKWCTAMMERPEHFEWYKSTGVLYRFIFNNDTKYSLHWANNGNKNFRDQLDTQLDFERKWSEQSFVLSRTPFEIDKDALEEISMDYMTRKWDAPFVKKWRKSKRIDSIEDYENYLKFQYED